jgi:alkylation response protein AidB-like acyl-CoA dehydrogenase
VLNGEKVVVSNGANADTLIVAARTAGEQYDRAGHQPVHRAGRCRGRGARDLPPDGRPARRQHHFSDVRVPAPMRCSVSGMAAYAVMERVVLEASSP